MSNRRRPTDLIECNMYMSWQQKKINARNKNIYWSLTFDEFKTLWEGKWKERGIYSGKYIFTRIDRTKGWFKDNIQVVKREKGNNKFMGPLNKFENNKDRQQHRDFALMKAQAKFRSEPFYLTFEDFTALWNDKWDQRGRAKTDYCLTRKDKSAPWNTTNTILLTRSEHLSMIAKQRLGITYNKTIERM